MEAMFMLLPCLFQLLITPKLFQIIAMLGIPNYLSRAIMGDNIELAAIINSLQGRLI